MKEVVMKSKRVARAMIVIVIIGMFVMLLSIQSRAESISLKASYINVGQGDSILLMDGNGFTVLIDGGTTAKDATIAAYMATEGVSDIDVMVNTHPDADHVGGLVDLLKTPCGVPIELDTFLMALREEPREELGNKRVGKIGYRKV
jgi:beta-lactamase superfamily II metal-dependent hydrolase